MSNIIKKQIIKLGKIIENYLINFPQYLDVKKNSTYKLEISDGTNRTSLKINIPSNNTAISCDIQGNNYLIDWGDKNINENNSSHTYSLSGNYIINIIGNYTYINSLNNNFKESLIEIQKLGNKITSLENSFSNCPNLIKIPNELLNDNISSCISAFANCTNLNTIPYDFILPTFCLKFNYMFYNTGINEFLNNSFSLPPNTIDIDSMFAESKIKYIPNNFFDYCTNTLLNINYCFANCINLLNVNNFNPIYLTKLSSIQGVFSNCTSLKKLNNNFNIHNKIINLTETFNNCINLLLIGNLHTHLNLAILNKTFNNCKKLNINIQNFLNSLLYQISLLSSTFNNCESIYGYIPAWYLWKSNFNKFIKDNNVFKNCININNYNSIPIDWGGNGTDNTYSYFLINITNSKYFILPIHRYFNNNQIATYKFEINYGDSDIWYPVEITARNINLWINNKLSIFNNYPRSIYILYKDIISLLLNSSEEQDMAYLKILNLNSYFLRNIIHKYENPGRYIISIRGNIDNLFVHHNDIISNSQLTKIFSILNLQLKSYNHNFCNAINLLELPNETLSSNYNADYMFYLNNNFFNKVLKIPDNFIVYNSLSSTNFMFYNFFTYKYINLNNNILPIFNNSKSSAIGMYYNSTGLTGSVPEEFYNNINVDLSGCFYNDYNINNFKDLPLSTIIDILNNQEILEEEIHTNIKVNIHDFDSIIKLWNVIISN